jgi:hypothetical protein
MLEQLLPLSAFVLKIIALIAALISVFFGNTNGITELEDFYNKYFDSKRKLNRRFMSLLRIGSVILTIYLAPSIYFTLFPPGDEYFDNLEFKKALKCWDIVLSNSETSSECRANKLYTCRLNYSTTAHASLDNLALLDDRLHTEQSSPRCTPPPPQPTPPPTFCAVEENLTSAAVSAEALRGFVSRCAHEGGILFERARTALMQAETAAYRASLICIDSSACAPDSFQRCLSQYTDHFSSPDLTKGLENRVGREQNSPRCTQHPAPEPVAPCIDERNLTTAENNGAAGLRSFVEACQSEKGPLVERAKTALKNAETSARDAALDCIRAAQCRTSEFGRCLGQYATDFPSGEYLKELRSQEQVADSRCKPKPCRNFQFNGESVCD